MNQTLLKYNIAPNVEAFSTTRISPFNPSSEDLKEMGSYAAFNVTDYCGDDLSRVKKNKEWLCQELGIPKEHLWLPHQTHTANVRIIDEAFLAKTEDDRRAALNEIDAVITPFKGHCIGVSTADCVPVLIYDKQNEIIAAIHAGWRGTVKRITQVCLTVMEQTFSTNPADCTAIIGPSISLDAFEVGEEVAEAFVEAGFPQGLISHDYPSKPHIDLWAANAYMLEEAGIPLEQIQIAGICTYNHCDTFFSARRLGIKSGRVFTGICMK